MWMIWQRMCQLTFVIYTNQILGNLDIRGFPTYKLDEAWFLLVNFWYMIIDYKEWFVFPSHLHVNFLLWQKTKPPLKNLHCTRSLIFALLKWTQVLITQDQVTMHLGWTHPWWHHLLQCSMCSKCCWDKKVVYKGVWYFWMQILYSKQWHK